MKTQFWITVGIAGLLLGCSDDAPGSKATTEPLSTAEDLPTEVITPSPLAAYAKARGMPVQEPRTPAKQYRLVGDLAFFIDDREIPQQGELWIGGADRMRFSMGAEGALPNVFLLTNREQSWLKLPHKEFVAYDPTDLAIETLMRWHTLRFPWGWQKEDNGELSVDTPSGKLTLEVNAENLPARVSLLGFHVALEQWQASQRTQFLMPMHWDWTSESGRRVEDYVSIHDRSLLLSSVFSPPKESRDDHELLPATGIPAPTTEDFDLVEIAWQSYGVGEIPDSASRIPGLWWEHLGERRFVLSPGVGQQPGAQQIETRTWLMWSTKQNISAQDAEQHMLSTLAELGVQADGGLWSMIPQDTENQRRSFLLPVSAKK